VFDHLENVIDEDCDAGIFERGFVFGAEEVAVPCDDFGDVFGHMHDGGGVGQLKDAAECVAEAEAADEDAGLRDGRMEFAGDFSETGFRARGGTAHELPAIEFQEDVAVVLVEGEAGAVGSLRFCEGDEGFQ